MNPPVIAVDAVELSPRPPEYLPEQPTRRRFDARLGCLSAMLGLKTLGCSVVEVATGAAAFPFHSHRANDELFYILQGNGQLRYGEAVHAVKPGDLIGCPAGGPATAHQLVNTGGAPLRYLAIGSNVEPEICEYPDSGKVGTYAGSGDNVFYFMGRMGDMRDYWDGE